MSETDKAGYVGLAIGTLLASLLFIAYSHIVNLQPVPSGSTHGTLTQCDYH